MAEEGIVTTADAAHANTVVPNTCSFTGPAPEESETEIRDPRAKKKRGETQRVVGASCLVQRYKHDLAAQFPAVDLFAESSDYTKLAQAVRALTQGRGTPQYSEGPLERAPARGR